MSVLNSITLKNAANADVLFNRESANGNTVVLRDSTQPIYSRAARVSIRTVLPTTKGNVIRLQKDVTMPVYDATGVKTHEYRRTVEDLIPIVGTEAERDEFLARVKALETLTVNTEMVSDLNFPS